METVFEIGESFISPLVYFEHVVYLTICWHAACSLESHKEVWVCGEMLADSSVRPIQGLLHLKYFIFKYFIFKILPYWNNLSIKASDKIY